MTNLVEQLEELNEILKTEQVQRELVLTEITDQSEIAKSMLSEKALNAISKKSNTLIYTDESGVYARVSFGAQTKTKNISNGISVVCKVLNALAEKDLIHSCLTPPSSIALAKMPFKEFTSASFSFVLVPTDRKKEVEALTGCSFEDGSLPEPIESLDIELKEDEFFTEIRISAYNKLENKSKEELLQEEIQNYLNILPKGTEVVEVVPCALIALSYPYEVRFHNPLMKDYREVRLEYNREIVKMSEDKIEQFNLLRSVEYIRKDAK